ncbi:MAG: ABC transporter ATP-binding protein [Clostridia bacterium]|nr:ABC transporter ATP-binding protein [Clostridia bacterium]
MTPDLEIEDLSVWFDTPRGAVAAVNGVSTVFRAGRVSGLIGESGSGKSVMGLSILRLLPNTARVEGKCLFGGEDLYHVPLARMREIRGAEIGLIPQNPSASLDPVMKLRRQLAEAVTAHGARGRKAAEAETETLLGQFGFERPGEILLLPYF